MRFNHNEVIQAVCAETGCTLADISGRRRTPDIVADRRVKSPVRAMIARLAAAHGVELKGGNNVSADARSLQAAIDGRRQRA